MEKNYENKYHALEETNWWFLGRQDIILQILKKTKKNSKILDVGCASGTLIKRLNLGGYTDVTGIDISRAAINACRKRGITNVHVSDAAKTKFRKNTFDIVIASDILEHCKYDKKAINEWKRILKPSGRLVLFVPAFMFLWGMHDIKNKHYRRYGYPHLKGILEKCGFRIIDHSFWNFISFFPKSVRILLGVNKWQDDIFAPGKTANRILFKMLVIENKAIESGIRPPVGVSIFVLAEKPGQTR